MRILKLSLLLLALFIFTNSYAQEIKPLTVKQFLDREKPDLGVNGTGASFYIGAPRFYKKFQVKGFVDQVFRCPACPPGAACEPCGNFITLSDTQGSCPDLSLAQKQPECAKTIQFSTDSWNIYSHIVPGTEIILEIETEVQARMISSITPEEREKAELLQQQNKELRQIFEDTLDKQPNLQPAKRPDWAKDIPGKTYKAK